MAIFLPIIGIPVACGVSYFSWKYSYLGACSLMGSSEDERSTTGAILGTGTTFLISAGFLIHYSRNSTTTKVIKPEVYTTSRFLAGSSRGLVIGGIIWCTSAVMAGIGSSIIGKYSPPKVTF